MPADRLRCAAIAHASVWRPRTVDLITPERSAPLDLVIQSDGGSDRTRNRRTGAGTRVTMKLGTIRGPDRNYTSSRSNRRSGAASPGFRRSLKTHSPSWRQSEHVAEVFHWYRDCVWPHAGVTE